MHTTTSFWLQTLLLLVLVILPSTMADIADSTAPIGCLSCGCDEAAPPTANEGRHPVRCSGHPGGVGVSHDPSPLPGSAVHPPSTPCNFPSQAGCPH
uniref:Secreted protein n=1 Tax=Oryza punctata TaxID=4537 RepID=A0A0E0MHD0_ORYPU